MPTKVLVMENTEGVPDMLSFSRTADYDVASAANASEALKMLSENRFHLVVSDVNVPDMDGIEFLCYIKKHFPGIEVIMTSDFENRNIGLQSLKYEASDFIVRPFTGESLDIVLERARKKISIMKKLSPAASSLPADGHSEIISAAASLIKALSASRKEEKNAISPMIAIHSPDGFIIDATYDYFNYFGDLKGKTSREIYKSEASCPVTTALESGGEVRQTTALRTRSGEEVTASVFAAPLESAAGKTDLILEVISFDPMPLT